MIEAKKMLRKIALLREGAEKRGFRIIKAEGRGIIVRGSSFTDEDLPPIDLHRSESLFFSSAKGSLGIINYRGFL